jgi:SAM-dependent methyltransferase
MQKNNIRPEFAENQKGISFLNKEIMLKEILKYQKSGKLLDVGCALGFFLSFAEKYFETYGIDISDYALKKAREIAPKSKLFVKDAQGEYPFKNNFFDVAVCFDVVEHLKKPENCIRELYRVLKPKGYLFLQTPAEGSKGIIIDDTHISLFSEERLKNILKDKGFGIVSFSGRRAVLYFNEALNKIIKIFSKDKTLAIDNYDIISGLSGLRMALMKKTKLLIYEIDKIISKFFQAPEMFIIARKGA